MSELNISRMTILFAACVAVATCLMGSVATADFIQYSNGHTVFGTSQRGETTDGTVNFAVYENASPGGDWTQVFGAAVAEQIKGLPPDARGVATQVDATADYIYFYQVVNNNPIGVVNNPLYGLDVPSPSRESVSSVGYIDGYVFNENGTPVGIINPSLGDSAAGNYGPTGIDTSIFDGLPTLANVALSGPMFAPDSNAISPAWGRILTNNVQFRWDSGGRGSVGATQIEPDGYGSILFFTSHQLPSRCAMGVLYGDGSALGDIIAPLIGEPPTPVPEPATLVLILAGAPLALLGWRRWRRRRQQRNA